MRPGFIDVTDVRKLIDIPGIIILRDRFGNFNIHPVKIEKSKLIMNKLAELKLPYNCHYVEFNSERKVRFCIPGNAVIDRLGEPSLINEMLESLSREK
jgi:hypothetical protein